VTGLALVIFSLAIVSIACGHNYSDDEFQVSVFNLTKID